MTDYNEGRTAELYQLAKRQPWRVRIEKFSLMSRLGDLAGQRVVDLACGEGHFTRLLKQAGAAHVVGVDLSERMIDLAREQEAAQPLGIDYRVADARELATHGDFDLAVSAWLLVYARHRTELAQMCRGIASWLRPGGRFVTFTTNPGLCDFEPPSDYRKYGFEIAVTNPGTEGAPVVWSILLDQDRLEIENYSLPQSAFETGFRDAGFQSFVLAKPQLDPQFADDRPFWEDFLRHPPAVLMDCRKRDDIAS